MFSIFSYSHLFRHSRWWEFRIKLSCEVWWFVFFCTLYTSEVDDYIRKNCPGKAFSEQTTLPSVLQACVLDDKGYEKCVTDMLNHEIVGFLGVDGSTEGIFNNAIQFPSCRVSLDLCSKRMLLHSGFVQCFQLRGTTFSCILPFFWYFAVFVIFVL